MKKLIIPVCVMFVLCLAFQVKGCSPAILQRGRPADEQQTSQPARPVKTRHQRGRKNHGHKWRMNISGEGVCPSQKDPNSGQQVKSLDQKLHITLRQVSATQTDSVSMQNMCIIIISFLSPRSDCPGLLVFMYR